MMRVLFTIIGVFSLTFAQAQTKPNILFLAIDDLNDWVGCLGGHPQAITPNIDRLAKEGTVFTNAHCQAPLCGPSRASIMTGMYPTTTGFYLMGHDDVIKSASEAASKAIFMPDWFEPHGYHTIAAGKVFHNGDQTKAFDIYQSAGEPIKPKERQHWPVEGFPQKGTGTDWGPFGEDENMQDYRTASFAIDVLNQKHDKPFFLATGFYRPHVPWHVPQKWFDMYPLDKIITPPYDPNDLDDVPEMAKMVSDMPMMPTTEWAIENNQWKSIVQAYLACVTFADAQIGRILDALRSSVYADNTIVVLWTDHGYHLGEKNRFAKQALWERAARVVLIMKAPGKKAGQRCDAPVQLVDMYPTLSELCGVPINPANEGHSLVPLLNNPKAKWDHAAFTSWGPNNLSMRSKTHRYTLYNDGSEELYDMKKDPNEWKNLAGDPKYNTIKEQFKAKAPKEQAPLSPVSGYWSNDYLKKLTNEARK